MSNLRDIQKLRLTRTPHNGLTPTHRLSQPTNDIYNVSFPQPQIIQSLHQSKQTYNKFLQSKQLLPKTKQRRLSHKRVFSNGLTFYQKRQQPNFSNFNHGLNIYNMSMKLVQRTPIGNMTKRDKKQEEEFQNNFAERRIPRTLSTNKSIKQISRVMFQVLYPIGKGGFGKVYKAQHKKTKQFYALKQMYKAKIILKKSISSVMNQRKILAKITHPFIINMSYAFQDRSNLYLIMDYLSGGDLRYHICRSTFNQTQSKFLLSCIILGLSPLHNQNIIHRDIKPQNLIFQSNGYLRLTDMGISRELRQGNYQDTSGTPGYMAPEVIMRKNHGKEADYFAIGVLGYQIIMGRRPYQGRDRREIREQIITKQAGIRRDELPSKWSLEAADFVNKLLIRNPANRLGSKGIHQIKQHPWLRDVDWVHLQKKLLPAPFIPTSIQQDYQQYKQQISQDTIDQNAQQNNLMLRDKQVQTLFDGYQYDKHTDKYKTNYTTNCTTETEGRETEMREIERRTQRTQRRQQRMERRDNSGRHKDYRK